jgi:antitoxin (DNA-binding transcriptional repressor) of toxin-antitoxin stability system
MESAMTVEVESTGVTLAELLEQLQKGDHVNILKDGEPIASLYPARSAYDRERAQEAMDRMDERAKRLGLKFDYEEFKADKEFGRR